MWFKIWFRIKCGIVSQIIYYFQVDFQEEKGYLMEWDHDFQISHKPIFHKQKGLQNSSWHNLVGNF